MSKFTLFLNHISTDNIPIIMSEHGALSECLCEMTPSHVVYHKSRGGGGGRRVGMYRN